MNPRCYLEISRSAFAHNVKQAKRLLAGDAALMVAIKSEAYGHGLPELAELAVKSGADALAVLDIDTGVALREYVGSTPLLCWLHSPHSDFGAAARSGLDVGISGAWQLERLVEQAPGLNSRVHLKIDTGLHRNGALEQDWPHLVQQARQREMEGHITVVGIWSHLADTSVEEDARALEKFHNAVAIAREAGLAPSLLHIAASAAAADAPETRLDLVRIGIIAYGVSPFDDRTASDLGFRPVMAAKARVMKVDEAAGTAEIGMGFTDGLLPPTLVAGWVRYAHHTFAIDSVEAEHIVVRSDGVPLPEVGSVITLWGDEAGGSPLAEDWASWAGTIGDEIVASLNTRVPRVFIDD